MKTLQLPLKTKWFEMTKTGIKTEDYREITPYFVKRLTNMYDNFSHEEIDEFISDAKNHPSTRHESLEYLIGYFDIERNIKSFDTNKMTLGYPKSTDTDKILILEHKGIEIRTGNPEWGAEPGKLYFVIKHGVKI